MLEKILTLNSNHFLRGISVSPYEENTAVFANAVGIDIYRNIGMLGSGYDKTDMDITVSAVTDAPMWFRTSTESNKNYVYTLGNEGNMYKIQTFPANFAITNVSDQISAAGVGQGFDLGQGANSSASTVQMIYTHATDVRKNTVPPSSASDFSIGTITSGSYHPVHFAMDSEFYIGDVNHLDAWDGNVYTENVLDLPANMVITNIIDDGSYLVIGATNNPVDGVVNSVSNSISKIYFWDTWSDSWNVSWDINDTSICSVKKKGEWIYVFGGRGLWRCNRSTEPQRVITKNQIGFSPKRPSFAPVAGGTAIWNGALLWSDSATEALCMYGSPDNRLPEVLSIPLAGLTIPMGVFPVDVGIVLAGENFGDKLYKFSTGNFSASAYTSLIDLGQTWKIWGIKIVSATLGSGDSLIVNLTNEAGTNVISDSYAFSADGAVVSKKIMAKSTGSNIADMIKLKLDYTGNVRVKRIDVFGEKQELTYSDR